MRTRVTAGSLFMAILMALTLASSVAAASPWTTFRQSGTHAFAFTDGCAENTDGTVTCESRSLDAFVGTIRQSGQPTLKGQQVCYSEHRGTFDPATGEPIEDRSLFGCAMDPGTMTVDQLDTVTLDPTVIDLIEVACGPTECTESAAGTITVHGTWTGSGPIRAQRGKQLFDDGSCVQLDSGRSRSRTALFEGSFEPMHAEIGEGTFSFRTTCSF